MRGSRGESGDRVQPAQDPARVGVELALGDPRFLEVEDVIKVVAVGLLHRLERRGPGPAAVRHAHRDQAGEAVGMEEKAVPRHQRAPVVADDHRRLLAERIDDSDHIRREVLDVVGIDLARLVALAVAAQIRGDRVIARLRERRQLVPPRIPGLGKAVEQEHQRSLSHFRNPQGNAIALHEPERRLAGVGGLGRSRRRCLALRCVRTGARNRSSQHHARDGDRSEPAGRRISMGHVHPPLLIDTVPQGCSNPRRQYLNPGRRARIERSSDGTQWHMTDTGPAAR